MSPAVFTVSIKAMYFTHDNHNNADQKRCAGSQRAGLLRSVCSGCECPQLSVHHLRCSDDTQAVRRGFVLPVGLWQSLQSK